VRCTCLGSILKYDGVPSIRPTRGAAPDGNHALRACRAVRFQGVGAEITTLDVNPCGRTFWVGLLKQRNLTLELVVAGKGPVTDGHDSRNTC
jgi:hypothetical protein